MREKTRSLVRKLTTILFISLLFFPIVTQAQDINYETEYQELLIDYEDLLDDYEEVINKLDGLNSTYNNEIDMHELSEEQIIMDQREIDMLRDDNENLIKLINPKYFTLYIIGGYQGVYPLGELAISASVPQLPFAVYAGVEYIYIQGVNMKLGIGVKF